MQREEAAGVSFRERIMEGSFRAVNRTKRNLLVDFNGISTVIRKAVSDSKNPVSYRVQREISEFGWYHGPKVRPEQSYDCPGLLFS